MIRCYVMYTHHLEHYWFAYVVLGDPLLYIHLRKRFDARTTRLDHQQPRSVCAFQQRLFHDHRPKSLATSKPY